MDFQPQNFGYSTKNIPVATQDDYLRVLVEKTEHLIRRMRWRAFFFLNPNVKGDQKETYGFKSTISPPSVKELKQFEARMRQLIQTVQFKPHNNAFQRDLKKDLEDIRGEDRMLVKADKTTNFYRVEPKEYSSMLEGNITTAYRKATRNIPETITRTDKRIAASLGLVDRIHIPAKTNAFITLKDHKQNFRNKPTCRLINPSKSEIGIISKQILDKINNRVKSMNNVNLWKNTQSVIDWFNGIVGKNEHVFITFDVCEFYPSITEDLLNKALDYASSIVEITEREREIITHSKRSLLFNDDTPWVKKNNDSAFDVTMGSYDGAETCELVGAYLLTLLSPILENKVGLYRDDGLAVCNATAYQVERLKKQISRIFSEEGLKVAIEANKKVVDFLDITLNLSDGTYQPFMKPNNHLLYVNRHSNHPPSVLKNIPESINRRLSNLSSSEEIFNNAAPEYQKALDYSGYSFKLQYEPQRAERSRRNRGRNITWYNPPWNDSVATNIGRKFLGIIEECFKKEHVLSKIFNRHTVKLSYSCMPNMKNAIAAHNRRILDRKPAAAPSAEHNAEASTCNCRRREDCPLSGKCLQNNVVYQAAVTDETGTIESYVGLATNFKDRYRNHTSSFNNNHKRHETELSKHIWSLKDRNVGYQIKWRILRRCAPYNSRSKRCNLCLYEKFIIICKPSLSSLNKRNELVSTCRHRNKHLLSSV